MKIRKCNTSDLEALHKISRKTFVDAFEKDNDPKDFKNYIDSAFTESRLAKELNNSNSAFYFLYVKGELAGYFKLNEFDAQTDIKSSETIELERIYILKIFQRKQLGSYMLKGAIDIAFKQKKKKLWLGVWEENRDAIRFYEKHGFLKFGTHPYFIGEDKQTDWLMQVEL